MDNGWGILRCIIDTCMKLKEGKYLIMKDPNKVILKKKKERKMIVYNFVRSFSKYL